MTDWPVDRWHGLYGEGWGNSIVDDAYAHPAKYRPALIRHIYDHLIEEGWVKEGDHVLDPFAGVALGGLHAMRRGLHFVGVELEEKFVTLAQANIDLWNERYSKLFPCWGSATILQGDSRKLLEVLQVHAQAAVSSPPYAKTLAKGTSANDHSARIARKAAAGVDVTDAKHLGGPHSVQRSDQCYGDTPGQLEQMPEGDFAASVSSPPYSSIRQDGGTLGKEGVGGFKAYTDEPADFWHTQRDQRNLGNLREPRGDFKAALASPPYEGSISHDAGGSHKELWVNTYGGGDVPPRCYSENPANLGNMEGGFDAALSSPPYQESLDRGTVDATERRRLARSMGISNAEHISPIDMENVGKRSQPDYGKSDGQLGQMKDDGFEAAVSSPPYSSIRQDGGALGKEGVGGFKAYTDEPADYWHTQRDQKNLGNLREPRGDFEAAVGSPPYSETRIPESGDIMSTMRRSNDGERYGREEGQLGQLPEGEFDASVSSPPYEASMKCGNKQEGYAEARRQHGNIDRPATPGDQLSTVGRYSNSEDDLGNAVGDTFWTAARTIVEQTYAALVPGGVAVWVVKAFVRDKAIVDFPGQWRKLCEAVGFVTLHEHHAMLVEDNGTQLGFFEDERLVTERKSFFRRLAESKGSPRIDWETVWCMRKPHQPPLWQGTGEGEERE